MNLSYLHGVSSTSLSDASSEINTDDKFEDAQVVNTDLCLAHILSWQEEVVL